MQLGLVARLTLLGLATALSVPATARACSEQPLVGFEIRPLWNETVHSDGVLVWEVFDYDGDASDVLEPLAFEVRREGVPVQGTIELVLAAQASSTGYAVFHPSDLLEPGAHEAIVEVRELEFDPPRSERHTFEVSAGTVDTLDLSALGVRLQPSAFWLGEGQEVCCEVAYEDSCGAGDYQTCEWEESTQLPELVWAGLPEARRPYTLTRTWVGEYEEGPSLWSSWHGSPYGPAGQPIAVPADEYCVRLEVMDLLDGSVVAATECTPHVDVEVFSERNDLAAFVRNECMGSPAFWEDSGERFRPEERGCSVGGPRSVWGSLVVLAAVLGLRRRRRS